MSTIIFTKLSEENLHTDSLDEFVRHQEVKECWRKIGNEFILVPNEFVEDWDVEKCRELFKLSCGEVKMLGAKKLYISAHSSKESQEAYRRLGCVEAQEVNMEIAQNEPFDIQMEYQL